MTSHLSQYSEQSNTLVLSLQHKIALNASSPVRCSTKVVALKTKLIHHPSEQGRGHWKVQLHV